MKGLKKNNIAREERRISMVRFHASQSQEQSVRSTDVLGRKYTVYPKNDECFYLWLFFNVLHLPSVSRQLSIFYEYHNVFNDYCIRIANCIISNLYNLGT